MASPVLHHTRTPRGMVCLPLRTATLPPADRTNTYLLGHHEALVVDPGSSYPGELERLRRAIARLRGSGGRIQGVLLTHHHGDHTGGAVAIASWQDAPVMAHPATLRRVALPGVSCQPLGHGQRLTVDPGLTLELVHTPGHAPGHLCLFEPEQRTLCSGDMVPGMGSTLVAPPEGDMALYLRSLRQLEQLAPRRILPAHGPLLQQGQAAIRALIAHRLEREQRMLQALGPRPRPLGQLTREAYAEVAAWMLPLAERSALAHLIKLQQEGRAIRHGEQWAAS